ncbi:MAG: phosphoglycerate dehydrogenase [Myxococcota bacterium]
MTKTSLDKDKIHILLLEGVHETAVTGFQRAGYTNIRYEKKALPHADLLDAIRTAHIVGHRSRTQLGGEVLASAEKLFAVGAFCIGTNQIDLDRCRERGIPVFNAPHANTRSVAELVLAEMVMMVRGIGDKSAAAHRGEWMKTAAHSHELRGKSVGIVGYGHIGSQVSILAEAFGLHVYFYDVVPKLPMGNATAVASLDELLERVDFVTLHVPDTPETRGLMTAERLAQMKRGAYLLNLSRGTVVDIDALADALKREHLHGAAIDVYPTEPKSNAEPFSSPLQGLKNVILTPHIGGSTQEAQHNIGVEVSRKLVAYSDTGATTTSVNFPALHLPAPPGEGHRLLHIHHNRPGLLAAINQVIGDSASNIVGQYLQTFADVGYVVIDIDRGGGPLRDALRAIDGTIRCRVLY